MSNNMESMEFFPNQYSYGAPDSNVSVDQNQYGGSMGGGHRGDISGSMNRATPGVGAFDDELPLLEELGINFDHIKTKTLSVLNPFKKIDAHIMDDTDLGGPIFFDLVLGFSSLMSGKVQFGYIYGLGLIGCLSINLLGYILIFVAIAWSTYSASKMFVKTLTMIDQRILVAYPVGLLYTGFALITAF
eukprot:gene15093-17868_t